MWADWGHVSIVSLEYFHIWARGDTCYCRETWGKEVTTRLCVMQIHLFDIDVPGKITFQESKTLSPGDSLSTFDTRTYHISLPFIVVITEKSRYFSFYVCPQLFYIALLEVQNGGKQTIRDLESLNKWKPILTWYFSSIGLQPPDHSIQSVPVGPRLIHPT